MYKVNIEHTAAAEDNFQPKLKVEIVHELFPERPVLEATLNVETLQDVRALTDERFEVLDKFIDLVQKSI
jgi:hypothetical protein